MKPRRPITFPFRVQPHAVAINGLTDAQVGKYFRDLLRDLDKGSGSTDEARAMIDYSKAISSVRRTAGLASARARLGISDDPNDVSGTRPAIVPRGTPPTIEHVLAHAAVIGLSESESKEFFKYWSAADWKENDGRPVANWKKKMANWKTNGAEKKALARAAESRQPPSQARRPGAATYAPDDPLFGTDKPQP